MIKERCGLCGGRGEKHWSSSKKVLEKLKGGRGSHTHTHIPHLKTRHRGGRSITVRCRLIQDKLLERREGNKVKIPNPTL